MPHRSVFLLLRPVGCRAVAGARTRRRAVVAWLLPLSLSGAACRDPGPSAGAIAGTYALRTVDGRALPIVLSSGASGAGGTHTRSLVALTYEFAPDGTARARITDRIRVDVPALDTLLTGTAEQLYERRGSRVRLTPRVPCPPNALCGDMSATGTLDGDRLELVGVPPLRTRYLYERVR